MRPVIGITTKFTSDDSFGVNARIGARLQKWHMIADDYIKSVELAGGLPIIIPLFNDPSNIDEIIDKLDGLILTGGNDVDPQYYGESMEREIGEIIPELDYMEIELTKKVINNTDIPVLGICRGHQLLNVACGGSLYQDLEKSGKEDHFKASSPKYHAVHEIDIVEDSKVFKAVRKDKLRVNSYHHQSIKAVAENLMTAAMSTDGIIEAVESLDERFIMGIQWHPEMMSRVSEDQLNIFRYFIGECNRYRDEK